MLVLFTEAGSLCGFAGAEFTFSSTDIAPNGNRLCCCAGSSSLCQAAIDAALAVTTTTANALTPFPGWFIGEEKYVELPPP